ncbi:efflux RND transporter periplasmic adaptor subunit [Pseudomonas capsici]|uniref:efflux RND transporter periplasmic adaptor subunit n=1 Tax=Pseudomonas capsici TaxID=2810614 RepID=UPI0021F1B082|nr:efflux RND transporter periplasmic adaptor subunit [Pseudomonas capsici]MCV4340859.1 efflux RND transporter periplasmic adaptor subunit [Pseudomonas capsici]
MVAAALVLLAGCDHPVQQDQQVSTTPVEAIIVTGQPMDVTVDLPGRIEPVRVAEVRARVAGIVLSRKFKEGSDVKAGEVLFQIDPAPFIASLARAKAELARTDAALFDAKTVVDRYQKLVEVEAVSRSDYDRAQATLKGAKAASQSAAAEVQTATLSLDYTTVRAPITGRIGRALVTEGTLVGQNEVTPMAMIQQLTPIYADFRQPVADVLRMRDALAAGTLTGDPSAASISVTIEGTEKKQDGKLLFSDITVDRGTGEIALRGELPNMNGMLLPGMYVRVHVHQGILPNAILVPQRAVQRTTDGRAQVLVVGAADTLEVRPVQTGAMKGGLWQISEGLIPSDRVVVGGTAAPGTKVTVTDVTSGPQG